MSIFKTLNGYDLQGDRYEVNLQKDRITFYNVEDGSELDFSVSEFIKLVDRIMEELNENL